MNTAHALTAGFDQYWHHIARRLGPSYPDSFPDNMDDLKALMSDAYHDGWRDAEERHAQAIGFFERHELGGGDNE